MQALRIRSLVVLAAVSSLLATSPAAPAQSGSNGSTDRVSLTFDALQLANLSRDAWISHDGR